jgi:thymidylate kinase
MTDYALDDFRTSNAKDTVDNSGGEGIVAAQKVHPAIPQYPLAGVIAVIGCDGSGKSTLVADLHAHLQADCAPHLLYLGQDSGNILRSILRLPLIGPIIGRYLVRRSQRAHAEGSKSASPDSLTALVVYLLSRWRRRKFRRMLALQRRGAVIITDRYPQAERQGFYFDGPGLAITGETSWFVRWLAARERRLYQDMAAYVPALLIRLNIDADTAHARKPDHKLSMLQDKVDIIPALTFNGAPILDLDARTPYPEVLENALTAARAVLTLGVQRDARD